MLKRHSDEDLTRHQYDWTFGETRERTAPAFTTLRQLLAGRELPEAESLAETEVIGLLNEIEFELMQR